MTRHFLTLIAVAALAACSTATSPAENDNRPSPSTSQGTANLNDTLSVPVGQSKFADAGKLELRFDARIADSRCAANVVCVWQGDAHVRLSTRVSGGSFKTTELHTALEPRKLVVDGYAITIVGMTPYPGSGVQTDPAVLIVRVTRE